MSFSDAETNKNLPSALRYYRVPMVSVVAMEMLSNSYLSWLLEYSHIVVNSRNIGIGVQVLVM